MVPIINLLLDIGRNGDGVQWRAAIVAHCVLDLNMWNLQEIPCCST